MFVYIKNRAKLLIIIQMNEKNTKYLPLFSFFYDFILYFDQLALTLQPKSEDRMLNVEN